MLALLLEDRCSGCNICVAVCPGNVLDPVAQSIPVIARPADCQTCFLCELYCPTDALYVDPDCEELVSVDAEAVRHSGQLGQFKRDSGWGEWEGDPRYTNEHWRMGDIFERARQAAVAEREAETTAASGTAR